MYDYKFIEIKLSPLIGKTKGNYEEIIKEHAQEGWRLHTFAPIPTSPYAYGQATSIQIIFEKELK